MKFSEGQIHLLIDGFKTVGPVLLKRKEPKTGPYDVWLVENLTTGQDHLVSVQSFSRPMNEMEVIAWAAR